MSEQLLTSSAEGVCEMRFNRPEKRNAITFAMYEALYRGLTEAQADEAARAGRPRRPQAAAWPPGCPLTPRAAVLAVRQPGAGGRGCKLAAAGAAGGPA